MIDYELWMIDLLIGVIRATAHSGIAPSTFMYYSI